MTTQEWLSSLGAMGAIVAALLRLTATAQQPDACQRLATTALPNATIAPIAPSEESDSCVVMPDS